MSFANAGEIDDPICACADAVAQWHASWLDAYDVPWRRDDRAWLALERPPLIYLGGITLSPDATAEDVGDSPAGIYDSWDRLELEPFGFERWLVETWFVRDPAPFGDERDPAELQVVRVRSEEVAEFEAVSMRGFAGEDGSRVEPGTIHVPNADERMTLWLGRVGGEAVAAAMSYETDHAVGIFGVTTIEPARGRGYASALMRRAVLVESRLPAVLNTDNDVAARLYEKLGFRRVGTCPQWRPGPVSRTEPDAVRT